MFFIKFNFTDNTQQYNNDDDVIAFIVIVWGGFVHVTLFIAVQTL